ncbi:hypothetical protein ACTXJM_11260 [Corynebacterium variabile]|uniref:hypothetical protein n=1 Tax=Corynebacterium variabile TaxID=1727 RepID=UPI003BB7FE72
MTNNHKTPDTSTPPVVEQHFTAHPDISDVTLTEESTTPRLPRKMPPSPTDEQHSGHA